MLAYVCTSLKHYLGVLCSVERLCTSSLVGNNRLVELIGCTGAVLTKGKISWVDLLDQWRSGVAIETRFYFSLSIALQNC